MIDVSDKSYIGTLGPGDYLKPENICVEWSGFQEYYTGIHEDYIHGNRLCFSLGLRTGAGLYRFKTICMVTRCVSVWVYTQELV